MVSAIGRLLQRIDGFRSGDGARDSSVYLENHTAVVDVVGRDAGSAALLVRALDPRTNAPTEVFRVNKDGSVSWVGLPKNVLDYGARGDGTGDDLAAIHAAVDALPAGGGTVYFPAGAYRITGPITNRGKHGVAFVGDGRNATVIQPSTASVDGFSFGTTGAEAGDYLRVADLQVSGGRYALRLNNCLDGAFERLLLAANVSGVYSEGQNERHALRDVRVSSSTSHGLNLGNTNGGDALVAMDLPLVQKWTVDGLIVDHAAGIGIKLGAGFLVAQHTSGLSQFTNVVCVLNAQGGFELTNCAYVTIQHYTGDTNSQGSEGSFHDVRVVTGTANGPVRVVDALFTGTAGGRVSRYALNPTGVLHLERCHVAVAGMATEAFAFNGGSGSVVDCVVPTAAGGVLISGTSVGKVSLRDVVDASGDMALPLVVSQGAASGEAIAFRSSGVAHGMTTPTTTDTFLTAKKSHATNGGAAIAGYSGATTGVALTGLHTTDDTGKTTAAAAAVVIGGGLKSGTTTTNVGANANVLAVQNFGTTRFILDGDGDSHQDVGTAWTNFDDHDDAALLTALSVAVSRDGDPVKARFAAVLDEHRDALARARLVTFNEDGHHFVNMSRLAMALVGAVRQQADQLAALEARLALAEGPRG